MGKLIPPAVSSAIGTILVGLLVGAISAAFVGTIIADSGILGGSGESQQAHQYMTALMQRETQSVAQLRPQQDVVSRALEEQTAQQSTQQVKPLSLTYLGGGHAGAMRVEIYAIEIQGQNGKVQFFPLALTLIGGKVVRTE